MVSRPAPARTDNQKLILPQNRFARQEIISRGWGATWGLRTSAAEVEPHSSLRSINLADLIVPDRYSPKVAGWLVADTVGYSSRLQNYGGVVHIEEIVS